MLYTTVTRVLTAAGCEPCLTSPLGLQGRLRRTDPLQAEDRGKDDASWGGGAEEGTLLWPADTMGPMGEHALGVLVASPASSHSRLTW